MTKYVTVPDLGNEFLLGTTVANKITVKVDGTSVVRATDGTINAAPPVWDNATKTITYPSQNGAAAQVIDLSEFTTDIYVNGATLNATTSILTLTDADAGTPDVVIDLSALLGIAVEATNLLRLGANGKALLEEADITTLATYEGQSAFGTPLFKAFNV